VLEEGELDNSIKMLSSSEVIKLSSVLTKNKSFVEVKELIEDVEFLVKFWTGKL
jgi:hypothetical protein|tara:strand:+ start:191 stop:352 length:162 start_codon:yes stop_codon:yes gene_type:complete